jgi:hypothetical protein
MKCDLRSYIELDSKDIAFFEKRHLFLAHCAVYAKRPTISKDLLGNGNLD